MVAIAAPDTMLGGMDQEFAMISQSEKPKPDARKDEKEAEKKKKHLNDLLDEGLKETFPASDPPAVLTPGHSDPEDE